MLTLAAIALPSIAQTLTPLQRSGYVDLAVGIGIGGGGGEYAPNTTTFDDWHPHAQFDFTAAGYLVNPACQMQNASGSVSVDTTRTTRSLTMSLLGARFRVPGPCGVNALSQASDGWTFSLDRSARFTLTMTIVRISNNAAGGTSSQFRGQQWFSIPEGTISLTAGSLNGSNWINPVMPADVSTTLTYAGRLSAGGYSANINQTIGSGDGSASFASTYSLQVFCVGDFNLSGDVGVQDIFDFLAAWFAGSPTADFNGVNSISVQDIFDFLAAWFSGC